MPHIHSMTIFGVDQVSIKYVPELNGYSIALIEGGDEKTVISIWRTANGGQPPELNVEGINFTGTREKTNAIDASDESDR